MINLNEAMTKIKEVGSTNVRVVPMVKQSAIDGQHQIQIKTNNIWITIVEDLPKGAAEEIIKKAVSRIILG